MLRKISAYLFAFLAVFTISTALFTSVASAACTTDNDCPTMNEPFCTPSKECGKCKVDSDCTKISSNWKFCSTFDGVCGDCRTDADCTNSAKPYCSNEKACGECKTDANCTAKYSDKTKCGAFGYCNEPPQCSTNADCTDPAKPVCDPWSSPKKCVECSGDADCKNPSKPTCNILTKVCYKKVDLTCRTDADCSNKPGTPYCTAAHQTSFDANNPVTSGLCVECYSQDQCRLGYTCDKSWTNKCIQTCSNKNENCPIGQYCVPDDNNIAHPTPSHCVACTCTAAGTPAGNQANISNCTSYCSSATCANDNDCGDGKACKIDPLSGNRCVTGCRTDQDCTDNKKSFCNPDNKQCESRLGYSNPTYSSDECAIASNHFYSGLSSFITSNVMWGAAFWAIDTLTSLLEEASVFGFQVGGALEPIDQTIDFFRSHWLTALTWSTISTFANWIAGGLIYSAIQLNLGLTTNNALVSYGSGIIVGLVNLGFVISLIVIGIATILRYESYGLKKTFWRLIVAVAMVNFTVALAAIVMNIGTAVTKSFYDAANPCPGLITNRFAAPTVYEDLKKFTKVDADQGTIEGIGSTDLTNKSAAENLVKSKSSSASGIVDWFRGLVVGIALDYVALLAAALISTIGAATFLAVAVFLIIRYVILMILLTFSPLIWLGFIFPKFKFPGLKDNVWDYWWEQFLKWTFYGPAMMIFLSLTSVLLSAMATAGGSDPNDVLKPVAQILSVIIVSAGGLFAANKFSGVAGGLVMAGASKGFGFLSTGVQNLGKMSLRGQMRAEQEAAAARARGESGAAAARRAQLLGTFGKSLQMPAAGTGAVFKQVGLKVPTVKPMTKQEVRAEDIKKAEDKIKGYTTDELVDALHEIDRVNIGTVENPMLHRAQRVAIMKKLADGGNLDKIKDVNYRFGDGVKIRAADRAVSEGTKKTFEAYAQKFGDVEKGMGMSIAMREAGNKFMAAEAAVRDGSGTAADRDAAYAALKNESLKWTKTLSPDDLKSLPLDTIFGKYDPATSIAATEELHTALRDSIMTGVLMDNPLQYAKLLNVKTKNFSETANNIKASAERIKASADLNDPIGVTTAKNMETVITGVNKMMANRNLYGEPIPAQPAEGEGGQGMGLAAGAAAAAAAMAAGMGRRPPMPPSPEAGVVPSGPRPAPAAPGGATGSGPRIERAPETEAMLDITDNAGNVVDRVPSSRLADTLRGWRRESGTDGEQVTIKDARGNIMGTGRRPKPAPQREPEATSPAPQTAEVLDSEGRVVGETTYRVSNEEENR